MLPRKAPKRHTAIEVGTTPHFLVVRMEIGGYKTLQGAVHIAEKPSSSSWAALEEGIRMQEKHARLLGHLYEGVLQPEAWLSALACHAQPYALLVWAANADAVLHAEQLAMLLGLTDTEARLALARGQSVKGFAAAQGCTWHTARTHSRNLLRKTGLHRQADLAGLVQSLLPL